MIERIFSDHIDEQTNWLLLRLEMNILSQVSG
jgi:hypothetical protein